MSMPHKTWVSTITFRTFRRKHTELNRQYWTSALGRSALAGALKIAPPTDYAADVVGDSRIPRRAIPLTVADTLSDLDYRANIERVHLLVVCSANLEAYLQDAVRIWAGSQGFRSAKPYALNPVGEAMTRPVIQSSTVPDMIAYTSELLQIDMEAHIATWKRGYKLRCAAAHNGGVVTHKVRKQIPELAASFEEAIQLEWDDLKAYFAAAEAVAKLIDQRISSRETRSIEVIWILESLKEEQRLPDRDRAWHYLQERYGNSELGIPEQRRITKEIYGVR